MVLVTMTLLVTVSIGVSGGGFRGTFGETNTAATQEAIVTVLNRAAADAIVQSGTYRPIALRQATVGLQVNGVAFDFDCEAGGGEAPQPGQVPDCPSITIGGAAAAFSNVGARTEGQIVAHLTEDQERAIVVAMTAEGRCAVAVGDVEEIVARYITDANEGVCEIPSRHID